MTTVFNLIILDESGSMGHVTDATISGCNEVLQSAKNSAIQNEKTQRQLMSIYAFQSGGRRPSRYIVKNENPLDVKEITRKEYVPDGCTPMLDAVGSTLSELLTVANTHEDAVGIVTIITDGYENSSQTYNWSTVARLINRAKELGWTINIIGANIDVDAMSKQLMVDNVMAFKQDAKGTRNMFSGLAGSMAKRSKEYAQEAPGMSIKERIMLRKSKSNDFFED